MVSNNELDNVTKNSFVAALSDVFALSQALRGGENPSALHNAIPRGKYLGTEVTAEQYASIAAGTFDDMWVGDYWKIAGVNRRIAHFNYYKKILNFNHILCVDDASFYSTQMNTTNTTEGAYASSHMWIEGRLLAHDTLGTLFGAHCPVFKTLITTGVTEGKISSHAWMDIRAEPMTERMVFGNSFFSTGTYNFGEQADNIECTQLALFRHWPEFIALGAPYWLRDVVSDTKWSYVMEGGFPYNAVASFSCGFRPFYLLA